ncbi:hypothetical protein C479_06562 [Halovivax asiaticus JCM 14624]|uniref:Cobalt transporter subunit CbtB n=1 Tax=Halovivax asiaticus JCM 14624 TaxID=1227490 RepID=M0BLD3_9EURY|nr:CbtB domain-containing protein [Halovivax asiaticus]ELZ11696.1 hypothetical protein C479_06562 [Halovivax asiaticus JCM 14624]
MTVAESDTVRNRVRIAQETMTPGQLAALLAFGAAIAFALVFVQEPLVHDSLHDFRHAAGITCH